MRPEDLFFLQIQGSGVLVLEDGARQRAVFDGSNGLPFVGIAAPMRAAGLLPDRRTDAGDIKTLAGEPSGAGRPGADGPGHALCLLPPGPGQRRRTRRRRGRPLVPGRSLAVDPQRHAMGELLWIEATRPGAVRRPAAYRRLAVALDTGAAIKGEVRADLYTGRGDAAGAEAGHVRHTLRLWRLAPTP